MEIEGNVMKMVCGCTYQGVGIPFDNSTCLPYKLLDKPKTHTKIHYKCDECACLSYAPKREPRKPEDWPPCLCGHESQAHN